uniref:Uncharacterized protein n=1 Tax=Amphimedon queenslandica TaxID=400682 RepID=A0A1X7UHA7_AMPQE
MASNLSGITPYQESRRSTMMEKRHMKEILMAYMQMMQRPLSQKLSELAQHVDFREERADDDNDREERKKKQEEEEEEGVSGPTTKKPSHRWPWEFTHSKLKQTLTEVSVLSDVLQIVHNHHQYLSLDPVYALDIASKILRKGAEPLKRLSSQTDHKFYRALYDLRRRWILHRTANGVKGDLSYRQLQKQLADKMILPLVIEGTATVSLLVCCSEGSVVKWEPNFIKIVAMSACAFSQLVQ